MTSLAEDKTGLGTTDNDHVHFVVATAPISRSSTGFTLGTKLCCPQNYFGHSPEILCPLVECPAWREPTCSELVVSCEDHW